MYVVELIDSKKYIKVTEKEWMDLHNTYIYKGEPCNLIRISKSLRSDWLLEKEKLQKRIDDWMYTHNCSCIKCGALGIVCRGAKIDESIQKCIETGAYDPMERDSIEDIINYL